MIDIRYRLKVVQLFLLLFFALSIILSHSDDMEADQHDKDEDICPVDRDYHMQSILDIVPSPFRLLNTFFDKCDRLS